MPSVYVRTSTSCLGPYARPWAQFFSIRPSLPANNIYLLHRYECFTVKYATCRFHMKQYSRDTSDIFSITSLRKISLTSFLCFSFVFRLFLFSKHSYLCNMFAALTLEIHFPLEINFICSRHRVISSLSIYACLYLDEICY